MNNLLFNVFDSLFEDYNSFLNLIHESTIAEKAIIFFSILLLSSSIVLFLYQTIVSIVRLSNDNWRNAVANKALIGYAISDLLFGWFVYMVGFYDEGTASSLIAMFIRPLLSSLEQFVFHSDLLEVSEICHGSSWYMTIYTISYFFAVLISSVVVVNCLRYRIIFMFRRLFWSVIRNKTINVFFGINDKSICLAKSIYDHDNKELIAFVSFPGEKTEELSHSNLSKVFGLRSFDKEIASSILSVKGIIVNASSVLFDDETSDDGASPFILEHNGLERLISPLKHSPIIRLFFLSDNENENIRAGINIGKCHALNNNKKVDIYCKARRTYDNYSLIDNTTNAHYHLVDDSSYAIDCLMTMVDKGSNNPVAHPINYVMVNKALGVVESKFTCLIVGFGQTGYDAMRFFYEFGSFVGTDGEKSPFYCKVVDKNMDNLLGLVSSEIPAVQIDDTPDKPVSKKEIEFFNYDINSKEFWNELEKTDNGSSFIEDLNCIVVAVGNDQENLSIATRLYEFAVRHNAINNKRGDCLKIFVRVYNSDEESRMYKVERFYTREHDVIRLFGRMSDIYCYNVIIQNRLQEEAKKYYESYKSVTNEHEEWQDRHDKLRTGTMSQRYEVRLKERQDRSNVIHKYTKLLLLGTRPIDLSLPSEYPFITDNELQLIMKDYYNKGVDPKMEEKLWYVRLENASKCEHLRWNSSLYMSGFIYHGDDKDFRLRQHRCLVGWNQKGLNKDGKEVTLLSDVTKLYDYKVVETTLLNPDFF